MKILVVGGGLFGICAAIILSENKKNKVTLVESSDSLLNGASKCNHNRLHLGFHYPRSTQTALQSQEGLISFFVNFKDAIFTRFTNYYMIEKYNSQVSADQYLEFCKEINVSVEEVWPSIEINKDRIALCLATQEPIWDYPTVKKILTKRLIGSNVTVELNREITTREDCEDADVVINTTYSNINKINHLFGADKVDLKLQDVVIPIMDYAHEPVGLTVMDGGFCSLMPNGITRNSFLLYHVLESVLDEKIGYQYDHDRKEFISDRLITESKKYFPFLDHAELTGIYRTIRALPINDNDERMTELFITDSDSKQLITVLSGKVSTCWSTAYEIRKILE